MFHVEFQHFQNLLNKSRINLVIHLSTDNEARNMVC